jgi:hypothetical protein
MGTGRRDQQIHPKTLQKLARRVVLGVQVGKLWRFRATEWTISSWVASATIHSIPARFDKLPRLSRRRDGDGAEPLARAAAAGVCGLHGQVCTAVAGKSGYPIGTAGGLRPVCEVAAVCEAGQLVEGDLLPSGFLGPHPGWGEPRHSRETKDEQRTEFTLCDDREGAANTRGKSDKTPCVYAIIDDEQGSYRDQSEGVGKVIQ